MLTNGLLVPNSGNRFNGLIDGGRRRARGSAGPGRAPDRRRLLADSERRAARALRRAAPVMPRLSLAYSLNPETVSAAALACSTTSRKATDLLAAEHPAGARQRHLRELQYLGAVERRRRRDRRARRHQRARSERASWPARRTSASACSVSSAATSSRPPTSATAASTCSASPTSTAPASTTCAPTRRCRRRSVCRPTTCGPTRATPRSACA